MRPSQERGDPFREAVLGDFSIPELIESTGEQIRAGVKLGADIAGRKNQVPKWVIFVYFVIIIFALIVGFSASPENQTIAFTFVFSQAPLLLKEIITR